MIADNQLAIAGAGWAEELLRIELATLHEEDYRLELVGFDDVELARVLEAQDTSPELIDEDAVPEVQEDPVARPGDLFILGDQQYTGNQAVLTTTGGRSLRSRTSGGPWPRESLRCGPVRQLE